MEKKKIESKKVENKIEEEIGKIQINEITSVVIRVDDFGGELGVNIRKWLETDNYSGFTKQGVRIKKEDFNKFKEIINTIDLEKY